MKKKTLTDAVRFIYAKASFDNEEVSKKICKLLKGSSKDLGYQVLEANPYSKHSIVYRPIKSSINYLEAYSKKWVYLVTTGRGREALLQILLDADCDPKNEDNRIRQNQVILNSENSTANFIANQEDKYYLNIDDIDFKRNYDEIIKKYSL